VEGYAADDAYRSFEDKNTATYKRRFKVSTETSFPILKWVKLVVLNLIYIGVVLYVFDHLESRTERLFVSILGLIYVQLTCHAVMEASIQGALVFGLHDKLIRIRMLLNDRRIGEGTEAMEAIKEGNKIVERTQAAVGVRVFFLYLIGLICLYQLFLSLDESIVGLLVYVLLTPFIWLYDTLIGFLDWLRHKP